MDWRALGLAVVRRRVELGFEARKAFAKDARLGERNLSDIEHGRRESYDAGYLARLERALQWPPGTVDAILQGLPAPEHRPSTPTPFGRFVLSCMREAGFATARAVADAAEVTPAAVTHLIYGTKDVDRTVVERVAKALGVPLEEFLVRLEPDLHELPLGRPLHPLAVEASDMLDPGSPLDDADREFLVRMLDLLLERMRLKMATRRDDR
jgi:transcriptional regulator with XRE-family HTH domain